MKGLSLVGSLSASLIAAALFPLAVLAQSADDGARVLTKEEIRAIRQTMTQEEFDAWRTARRDARRTARQNNPPEATGTPRRRAGELARTIGGTLPQGDLVPATATAVPVQRPVAPDNAARFEALAGLYGYESDWRSRAMLDLQSGRIDLNGNVHGPLTGRTGFTGSER